MPAQKVAPSIRLEQVANLTGVSVATVSRALRGTPGVAAHTRAKVQKVAAELGYPVVPLTPKSAQNDPPVRRTRTRAVRVSHPPMVGIAEVAALAGVSQATVSRALQGTPNVAARTREAVQNAAAELGYVGSPIAAALATGRTNTVGVLATGVTQWFFGAVLEGIREAVADSGYDILVYPVNDDPEHALTSNISRLRKRVDGVLRINVPPDLQPLSAHDSRMPLVTIGSPLDGIAGVQLDDVLVGYLATQHLLQLGHRHIAFLGLDPAAAHGFTTAPYRHQGFTQALNEAGLPVDPTLVKTTGFAAEAGAAALNELLTDVEGNARRLPTAVVAVSDEVAMGVIYAARQVGISVPHELSVIGVDNHDLSYLFDLTTIDQSAREQGRVAAAMLLEQIRRRDRTHPQLISTRPELVHRNSTAPPRNNSPFQEESRRNAREAVLQALSP